MAHVRKQIRDAVVTRLTGLTTTAANVTASRVHPYLQEDAPLPALAIYTTEEQSYSDEIEMGSQRRELILVVEGYAQATSAVEDTLDTIASEVETAIYTDQSFSGLVLDTTLDSSNVEMSDEAGHLVGTITINFRLAYMTREGSPETAL
jgi:hypothetical protein